MSPTSKRPAVAAAAPLDGRRHQWRLSLFPSCPPLFPPPPPPPPPHSPHSPYPTCGPVTHPGWSTSASPQHHQKNAVPRGRPSTSPTAPPPQSPLRTESPV
ncbi:hypothetical protein I4F81_006090 [Pyropia yezoensis]|uniref:Uncharacterized protein n=1 Tax=Pyropia yezoensis TaxID=2788 RepID=A0ACC3BZY7_PYRYE|nr:hypothetical protein I4F81_006090 [Neopyropia yezoensis]